MKKAAFLFFLIALWANASAQITDTLQEVSIRAKKKEKILSNDERLKHYVPGQKVISFDSATREQYQFQNVATLLSQQSPVFIRSYGFNNLATLNFRGSSSAQSQVLWNGIPIQNAAIGVADVSLLPVSVIDNINVVYGGSSAMWGSGNVGGALLLENNAPAFDSNGFWSGKVAAAAGSFSQYHIGAQASLSTKKFALSVNTFGQTAENDFSYLNNNDSAIRMKNAQLYGGALMANAAYKSGEHSRVGLSMWYQQYYREIPAALFEVLSTRNQRDESLRLMLDWKRKKNGSLWYVKGAFTKDYLEFKDERILFHTQFDTYQLYGEAGWQKRLGNHYRLMVFTPVQLAWLDEPAIQFREKQLRVAASAALSVNYLQDRLQLAINGRAEQVDEKSYLLPGINASYSPLKWLSLKVNLQRSYRVPTLNELYYKPGGNRNLKPEQGWSSDLGYGLQVPVSKHIIVSHGTAVFNRVIENWILWFGGSIWTPHNVSLVHSRGIETDNSIAWSTNKWRAELGLHTSYIRATTVATEIFGNGSIGKQLPYTPRFTSSAYAKLTYDKLTLNYIHTYTGNRYITIDESGIPLAPYHISNIHLSYFFDNNALPVQITAQCNNIFDVDYQVIGFRPMPGINWLIGLKTYIY